MKTLRPITEKLKYSKPIEEAIYKSLYDNIFKPIFEILLKRPQAENASTTTLINYLKEGKLTYEGGYFRGRLNATVSTQLRAIGANYSKFTKAYQLSFEKIPVEIKAAIAQGDVKNADKATAVENFLKAADGRQIASLDLEEDFGKILLDLNKQFIDTTKKVMPENISVTMSPHHFEQLKTDYAQNLEKYVQDWHDEAVVRLRNRVLKNTALGYRSEALVKVIQRENRVSFNKAKFLARQETSILVAKYRKIRYTENGINWYMWATSHDSRVRHDHKILNGTYHEFTDPPVTDQKTMARNNPGEDYGCRCDAIPVISERQELYLTKKKEANQ